MKVVWGLMAYSGLACLLNAQAESHFEPTNDPLGPFNLARLQSANQLDPLELSLQSYALAQLRMVGTIFQLQQRYAIIQDPDKRIHLVTQGSKVGLDLGEVQHIYDDKLLLIEHVQNDQGKWVSRSTQLRMQMGTSKNLSFLSETRRE